MVDKIAITVLELFKYKVLIVIFYIEHFSSEQFEQHPISINCKIQN